MKIRSDFVSNSSSSSFILKDAGFFRHFGITKQDLDDAFTDLCGGKEFFAKKLADEIAKHEIALANARIEVELSTGYNSLEYEIKYNTDRLRELKAKGLGMWCIYDMTDEKDRRKCFKEWDDHFASWFAPDEGEYETWDKFEDMLRWKCGFDNVFNVISGREKTLKESRRGRKSDRITRRTVPGGAEFVKRVKSKLEVKTMKEVLHDKGCTLMIHFGDNYVYEIDGMTKPGRADEEGRRGKKKGGGCEYASKAYSEQRFFEILIGYFVKKGRINLSDPGLLNYWKIDEKDAWYRKTHPGKEYYLDGDVVAWEDVYNDMLNCNAVMHEG